MDTITSPPHPELLARIEDCQTAFEAGDVVGVAAHLHADSLITVTVPSAVTLTRAEFLALVPDYVVHLWQPTTRLVDVDVDTAMVLTITVMCATILGVQRTGTFIVSDCWRRPEDGPWMLWRRHSTMLDLHPA